MPEFPPPLTVGLFGTDPDFLRILGAAIGKTGTESDLRFWNKKDRDLSITAIAPSTYPEKLVPMLQVAALCDYPVLDANRLDAAFGEMAIALASAGKKGLLILRDPQSADRARALVKDRLPGWVHMDWTGDVLISWLYQRCGKSEEAHAAMKNDFAGGKFPSGDFGENAAWWWIMILAYNLNALMKRLVLGGSWVNKRMKAIRFGIINIAARVVEHSRRLRIRISGNHPSGSLLIDMRRRILQLEASG